MKISVVVITYNEERNIRRCLESVQDFAAEIIVVDSGSKDKTTEICRELGATVIHHPFEGHVEQKNFALTQAGNEWVLSLDADEALTAELKASVIALEGMPKVDGFTMNRLTSYCGQWIRHSGWYPDQKLRLFNRHKGKWSGTNPHDKFNLEAGCATAHLRGDLLHYSYHSLADHHDKINLFSTIGAQAMFEQGQRSSILKIVFKPMARFLRHYVFKMGFLDGLMGYNIAVNTAHASFLKYLRLYYLQKGRTI